MDFKDNYRKIGCFDVSSIRHHLAQLNESDWMKHNRRQQQHKAHVNTHMIPLLYDDDYRFSNPTKHAYYSTLDYEITLLLDLVSRVYDNKGYPLRLLLTRLLPNAEILPHTDKGPSLRWVHRIHIPIQTNALVTFKIGGEILSLKEGELWEINNCHVHNVKNASRMFRIHLILDWVTPSLVRAYLQEKFNRKLIEKTVTHKPVISDDYYR